MASRESINRVRIEGWRLSRVPVTASEAIYQGDLMVWNAASKVATKAVAASGAQFLGVSDTKNPIETAGSTTFLSDTQSNRINVIQQGLVEHVWAGGSVTVYPFDSVYIEGTDAQKIKGTGSNAVGFIDPAYGAAGKAVVDGDLVRWFLQVPNAYRALY